LNSIFQEPDIDDVRIILQAHNLPTEDLPEINLFHFFGCGEKNNPKGVIGLEVHGSDGLLRSLAVDSEFQNQGCASSLYSKLEKHSKSIGIKTLYLLTETAVVYFERKGFNVIKKDLASDSIKQTKEFSELCPDNATLMRKAI